MEHYKSWRKISGRNNDYDVYMFTEWNITNTLNGTLQILEHVIVETFCFESDTLQLHLCCKFSSEWISFTICKY